MQAGPFIPAFFSPTKLHLTLVQFLKWGNLLHLKNLKCSTYQSKVSFTLGSGTHGEWWPYWRPWRWWVCDGIHWEWWRWWCVIADEAKWGLGPGLPQCYAESSAKNGGFGAGEHSDQGTKQQAAAPSGTPTGTHKAHCTWYWKKVLLVVMVVVVM